MTEQKICRTCKITKDLHQFYYTKKRSDKRMINCKSCHREKATLRYNNNKETILEKRKEHYKTNSNKLKKDTKNYRKNNSVTVRDAFLKRKFGISLEKYNELLNSQNKVCAICNKKEDTIIRNKVKELSVDHCHKTGKIRGLLCNRCNISLGGFLDSVEILKNAVIYLNEGKTNV